MAVVSYKDTIRRFLRSPMQKTYTFAGATLILVLVFLLGAIRPTVTTITRLNSEIKQRELVSEQLQEKINIVTALNIKYAELSDDLTFLSELYPQNSDFSLLMANLENITNLYSFTLNSLSVSKAEDFTAFQEGQQTQSSVLEPVAVRMTVTGKASRLPDLLKHLESLPYVPDIAKVNYIPSLQEGGDDTTKDLVDVTIEMYVSKVRSD